ncbi:MAG TPA: hypothetical protein VM577_19455 [Anaerovoracaceae bacterium]|nr:hypothetical protein [Anaerovoracaceae bacterium]
MRTKERDQLYDIARRLSAISTSTLWHHGMKGYEGRKTFILFKVSFSVSDEQGFCISYYGAKQFYKKYYEDGQMRDCQWHESQAYHLTGKTLKDLYASIAKQDADFSKAMNSILEQTLLDLHIKEERQKFIDKWIAKLLAFFSTNEPEPEKPKVVEKQEPTAIEKHEHLLKTIQDNSGDAFMVEYAELYQRMIGSIKLLKDTLKNSRLPNAPKYIHFMNNQVYINVMENWKAYRKVTKVDKSKLTSLQTLMMEQAELILGKLQQIEEEVSNEYASEALQSIEVQHQVLKQMTSSI